MNVSYQSQASRENPETPALKCSQFPSVRAMAPPGTALGATYAERKKTGLTHQDMALIPGVRGVPSFCASLQQNWSPLGLNHSSSHLQVFTVSVVFLFPLYFLFFF